ncbi:amino acid adenylation domain-containing protein [Spirillospora sp. NPDC050679]
MAGAANGTLGELNPFADERGVRADARRNRPLAPWPPVAVPDLVARQVEARPTAPALTHRGRTVDYRGLWDSATRLARALAQNGVGPGDRVAALLSTGPASVVVFLGTLLAGGCHVPIDVRLPRARASFILRDCGARCVIGEDGSAASYKELEGSDGSVRLLDLDTLIEGSGEGPLPEVGPSAPAYMVYTSGTTGRPKGMTVSHGNLVSLLANSRFPFDFSGDDVWPLFHSPAFDLSVWEVFGCLAYGGRLVVPEQSEIDDPRRFRRLLADEGITVLNQTPSAFGRLIAVDEADPLPLPGLRYVIFGGERLAPRTLLGWRARHPQARLVNMYGISEATIHSTVHELTDEDLRGERSPIGEPLPSVVLHLMDLRTGRRPVPDGAAGEIWLGGGGVVAGYHGLPEQSRERFVTGVLGSGRFLRTGDLARRGRDGRLEYLRRADDQFQWHGYRIEPEEIAEGLRAHPEVADAAAVLVGGSTGRIVAFVAPVPGARPSAQGLREHLAERLPHYMVPQVVRTLPELPLTGNGKVDRAALADLEHPEQPGEPEPAGERHALSATQQRIFTADRLTAERDGYVETAAWRVAGGPLDVPALRSALAELTRRHPILRASFALEGGRPGQRIGPAWNPPVEVVEGVSDPTDGRRLLAAAAATGDLDPATGRVLGAVVLRGPGADDVLVIRQHHLVTDERSLELLMEDLDRCYTAVRQDRTAPPWEGPGFHDLMGDGEGRDRTDAKALRQIRQRLADAPVSLLPSPPAAPEADGLLPVRVPVAEGALRAACRARRATRFTLEAAAVAAALHRWLGLRGVTFGIAVADRGSPDLDRVLGPRVDLLVLRSQAEPEGTAMALVRDLRDQAALALGGRHVPFDALIEELRPRRLPGIAPYCEVLLSAAADPHQVIGLDGHRLHRLRLPATARRAGHPVMITAHPDRAAFDFDVGYQGDRVAGAEAEALTDHLADALARIVRGEDDDLGIGAALRAVGPRPATAPPPSPTESRTAAADAGSGDAELGDQILGIWRRVLESAQVGMDDNFFDVGGDSGKLVLVHAELEAELGVRLPVTDLFACPTVRSLADRLAAAGAEGALW